MRRFSSPNQCLANKAKCYTCGMNDILPCMFADKVRRCKVLRSKRSKVSFLAQVSTNNQARTADIQVKDAKMTSKLDTTADINAIADTDLDKSCSKAEMPVLQQPEKLSTEQWHAQVEKEALGTTWACERFQDFLKCFCVEQIRNLLSHYWDGKPWIYFLQDFSA